MKTKQIIISLAVLALLSAYFYFFGVKKKADEQKMKDESVTIFPGVNKDDITEVTLKMEDKTVISAKKTGNEWEMTSPKKVPANKHIFDSIVNRHLVSKADRRIENANLADYGLDNTNLYAEYGDKNGKKYRLYMAGYNPTGGWAYAYKEGDNSNVYLVSKDMRDDLSKDLNYFRYGGLLIVDENDIDSIEVKLENNSFSAYKKGEKWYLSKPYETPAKKERLMTIANYAVNSALKSYKPASMASRYGLDNPKEYIKLGVKGKTQSIFFGKKEKDRSSVYAISSLIDEIVEVPDYIYNGIPKADELPNKQILDFLQDDVQKVEIKYNDRDLEIVRNKPGSKQAWYFTRSKGLLKKDQVLYNMNTILNGIFWFEMKEKIEAPGRQREKNEFYLDPPYAEIRLWGKDGKDLGHILLGSKAFGEDIYVKVPEKNTVYKMLLQSAKNMNLPQFDIKAE